MTMGGIVNHKMLINEARPVAGPGWRLGGVDPATGEMSASSPEADGRMR